MPPRRATWCAARRRRCAAWSRRWASPAIWWCPTARTDWSSRAEENPGTRGFALRLGAQIDMIQSCSGQVILAFFRRRRRPDGARGGGGTR
ncbi:hypothetical protein AB5I41_27565 [Sphingomonas sp. MMS24-JH45]